MGLQSEVLNSQGCMNSSWALSHSLRRQDSPLGINCVLKDTATVCLWDSGIISSINWRILDKGYRGQKDALRLREVNGTVANWFCSCFSIEISCNARHFTKPNFPQVWNWDVPHSERSRKTQMAVSLQKCWASAASAEIRGSWTLYRENAKESCVLQEAKLRWNWYWLAHKT